LYISAGVRALADIAQEEGKVRVTTLREWCVYG